MEGGQLAQHGVAALAVHQYDVLGVRQRQQPAVVAGVYGRAQLVARDQPALDAAVQEVLGVRTRQQWDGDGFLHVVAKGVFDARDAHRHQILLHHLHPVCECLPCLSRLGDGYLALVDHALRLGDRRVHRRPLRLAQRADRRHQRSAPAGESLQSRPPQLRELLHLLLQLHLLRRHLHRYVSC